MFELSKKGNMPKVLPKPILLILALTVILIVSYLTLATSEPKISKSTQDAAVNQAKFLYQQKKARGEDLSNGPCLTNALIPGWVADIAHNPRQTIDDLSENQCAAYVEGSAQHFVELDLEGNLIRVR